MNVKFQQAGNNEHFPGLQFDLFKKPIEIYAFTDPLCHDCLAIEPTLKKLQIEYGRYFKIRHIISGNLCTLSDTKKKKAISLADAWKRNMARSSFEGDAHDVPLPPGYLPALAIKAAELQGHKHGVRYLRQLQEKLFVEEQDIHDKKTMIEVANAINLDVDEFKRDLHSHAAIKAFQCDLNISEEMEVDEMPALVFFNHHSDEEGIKISGHYEYDIYVDILSQLLQKKMKPSSHPSIEEFIQFFKFVTTKEIEVVYNLTAKEVERIMKPFLIKQKVERVPAKLGTIWRYIGHADVTE